MKRFHLILFRPVEQLHLYAHQFRILILLIPAIFIFSQNSHAGTIKVMKRGLGEGSITVAGTAPAINCGTICDANFTNNTDLTFNVAFDAAQYTFVGWEGALSGTGNPVTRNMTGDIVVTAIFALRIPFPTIADFSPGTPAGMDGIRQYLIDNPGVNTPARFVSALPRDFRQNWILMTRSESLQTGTAKYPRLLLPSADGRFVFTIGLSVHGSYPGSHPMAIEYMQWDATQFNFRFHEIVLGPIPDMGPFLPPGDPATFPARSRMISVDDSKCSKCHSTRNVLNAGPSIGTNGIPPGLVPVKNKPNWEAYDSWGGMMPFNRDRIYQGSIEDQAFRGLFNLWNWRGSALKDSIRQLIEQLELQPPGVGAPHNIDRNMHSVTDNPHIAFGYDGLPALTNPPNNYPPTSANTTHAFGDPPVAGAAFDQGGRYVTLRHSLPRIPPRNNDYNSPGSDEGRAVRFFDGLGGLISMDVDGIPGPDGSFNAQRVADEVANHRFATGSVPIDVRPIALAVTRNLLRISGNTVVSTDNVARPFTVALGFFNDRNGMTVDRIFDDTEARTKTIPARKTKIAKINLDRSVDQYLRWRLPARAGILAPADGLFQEYPGIASPTLDQVRQEVFQRPIETFVASTEINNGVFVDREDYSPNTNYLTLYRYFLEPLGVSVDKWSMGVRGRSRAYAFADVFSGYVSTLERMLSASLDARPAVDALTGVEITMDLIPTDAQVMDGVNRTLSNLPASNAVPRYTDLQRIWNKACIECHGGLEYPPYSNYTNDRPGAFNLSEDESGVDRIRRSYDMAIANTTTDLGPGNNLYSRITQMGEDCPYGVMPCEGPKLSNADIKTIERWIQASPVARPYTVGDPHLKTVDGVSYDFQAAGEYVLLRGDFFEIQTRHAAVATVAPYGPNRHTGLTTCVSINTAVAMNVAGHRITYQPNLSGEPDPDGLQLRIDGKLTPLPASPISFAPGSRILSTSANGGVRVDLSGGTSIIITPWYWQRYQVWGMAIDLEHPRATEGIMGAIAPGSWLPPLPDGRSVGPKPKGLGARYKVLYGWFAEEWQVNDSISLFDYAPGTSTATFAMNGWPNGESPADCSVPNGPGPNQQAISRAEAEGLCNEVGDPERRELCILDVMATAEAGFAVQYIAADKILRNEPPTAPVLTFPENFAEGLTLPINFQWDPGTDKDGDPLTYSFYVWPVHEAPDNNKASPLETGNGGFFDGNRKWISIIVVIILLIWLILYFLLRKNKKRLLGLLTLLLILGLALAYYFLKKNNASTEIPMTRTVSDIQPGRDYFWRVIVEDAEGHQVQSETRRFELK
jgi:uncharacterized repeat protein (TIGR02543 family)